MISENSNSEKNLRSKVVHFEKKKAEPFEKKMSSHFLMIWHHLHGIVSRDLIDNIAASSLSRWLLFVSAPGTWPLQYLWLSSLPPLALHAIFLLLISADADPENHRYTIFLQTNAGNFGGNS